MAPDGIRLTYTAVVEYTPEEVEEHDLTEFSAQQNLLDLVAREPESAGQIETERIEE